MLSEIEKYELKQTISSIVMWWFLAIMIISTIDIVVYHFNLY